VYKLAMALGDEKLALEDWRAAEVAYAAVLKVPGYGNDPMAKEGLAAARGGASLKAYTQAMAEGDERLAAEDWRGAEAAYAAALKAPGYGNDPAAKEGLAASAKARNQRINAEGLFREEQYARALSLFREAAEAGDPVSENYLGDLYFEGLGVENDFAEAMDRYRRAAEAGYAPAQDNLGFMLEHGVGVAADPGQAAEWYAKAHAQEYAPAAYHLARLRAAGQGVEKDAAQAGRLLDAIPGKDIEKLFLEAADRGFTKSQYELALLHHEGIAGKKDARQAAEWFKKVAANDRADRRSRDLGDLMYEMGESSGDYEVVINLYLQACAPVFAMGGK
jgi:TPR repeat protein